MTLDKNDSQKLKALAILFIILHNYLHLTNSIGENEFKLNSERIFNLYLQIVDSPIGLLNYLFTYFGWYFIVIFIFITSYGFIIKIKNGEYIFNIVIIQAIKTTILLLIGATFLFLLTKANINETLTIVIRKILSFDNFSYQRVYTSVGSWWYFGLFFQLCIIIPTTYFLSKKINIYLMYSIIYCALIYIYIHNPSLSIFATAFGHIPEVIFAIQVFNKNVVFNRKILFISIFIFSLTNFYNFLFPFTYITFLYLTMYSYSRIKHLLNKESINNALLFIGSISPFLFITNGPIRDISIRISKNITFESNIEIWQLVASLLHLFCVILIASIIYSITHSCIKKIVNKISQIFP